MDKRNKQADKKIDKIKDRGDLKKSTPKKMAEDNFKYKIPIADRGDSWNYQKLIRLKINESRPNHISKDTVSSVRNTEKWDQKQVSNLDIRKLIRERNNNKEAPNPASNLGKEVTTTKTDSKSLVRSNRTDNRSKKRFPEFQSQKKLETYKEIPKDATTTDITNKKPEKESTTRNPHKESTNRKPIIKTVTSKNASKIFKAVTFGEARSHPKPLRINIPNNEQTSKIIIPSNKVSKSTDTVALVSKTSGDNGEKPEIRRKIVRKRIRKNASRPVESPDSFKICENTSPPTEVAKWAPCCINRHTKPYYEAWVNTTLAAISKNSKKDKLFLEKRSIIQSFQKAWEERAASPELYYEKLKDERYTGRIRVVHR